MVTTVSSTASTLPGNLRFLGYLRLSRDYPGMFLVRMTDSIDSMDPRISARVGIRNSWGSGILWLCSWARSKARSILGLGVFQGYGLGVF